jgi:4-hydroxy-3-methylbut-2-enyl diphosphate reductase
LCYATNENQDSTYSLLKEEADLAIVVGGYNSSNTSHLVELCEQKFPTYFISSATEIENDKTINHFNWHTQQRESTQNYLPSKSPVTIILTSGASCPDAIIEGVIQKLASFFEGAKTLEEVVKEM